MLHAYILYILKFRSEGKNPTIYCRKNQSKKCQIGYLFIESCIKKESVLKPVTGGKLLFEIQVQSATSARVIQIHQLQTNSDPSG
jgi:hypothetical protein